MVKVSDHLRENVNGVLFVCVANSARSQMAEGLARAMAPASIDIYSAGSEPSSVNPHAIAAMDEIDIDIRGQSSKSVDDIPLDRIAVVVTLCAEAECPAVLTSGKVTRLAWPLPDPAAESDDPAGAFRAVRETLQERLTGLFA